MFGKIIVDFTMEVAVLMDIHGGPKKSTEAVA